MILSSWRSCCLLASLKDSLFCITALIEQWHHCIFNMYSEVLARLSSIGHDPLRGEGGRSDLQLSGLEHFHSGAVLFSKCFQFL